ncbi:MAG TPA: radical SAM protein [Stellaceae bacterium]|nr:radical SAM protein [Stellaceae bacterium]
MLNPETLVRIHRRMPSRKLKAFGFQALRTVGLRHLAIRIDTINLCNLRCKMCYYSLDYKRKKAQMELPLFRKIADEVFPRTRFLYLSCATEPLMNKQFADFVRVTGEYKIPFTSFCTNGQLLTEKVVDACIDSKFSEIIFSIDGATAETYEEIRRGGKWDRLVKNLDMLTAMKRNAGSRHPAVRMNFTCMQTNIHELPAMVDFAADRGAESLHVRHLVAFGDTSGTYEEELSYRERFNGMAEQARRIAAARGIGLFLPDPIPTATPSGKTCVTDASRIARQSEANPYCMLPWFQAIIDWRGDYRVCAVHTLGNLAEQSFDEIYNGPKMREIRRNMLHPGERSCSWNCHQEAYDVPEEAEEPALREPALAAGD